MPIDKSVTIRFISEWETAEKIQATQNELYQFENSNANESPNGLVEVEMYIDGNWWEQDNDNITLSKMYPTIEFNVTTQIFGEDADIVKYLNGEVIPKESKGWLDLTLSEISNEYGEGEPLDGDDVDRVCEIIKHKLNLFNGNITQAEYDVLIELKPTAEPQGEFVNDNQYQVFDVVCVPFVDGEGFSSTDIFDYDDNHLGEIYSQEVPNDEDDIETLLSFEKIIKEWLVNEGYL